MSRMKDNVRIRDNVESEEELLRLQDEFLASKPKAAATVIKSKPPTIVSSSPSTQLKNNVDEKTQKDIITLDDNEKPSSNSIKGEVKSKKKKSIFSAKRQKSIGSSGGAQRFEIDLD